VGTLANGVRAALDLILYPFDLLPVQVALFLVSVLTGVGLLWVVGKTTPQKRIERARSQVAAAIYEIRLFLDSPLRIFKAQGRMLGWSMLYVGYMLPAFILLSLPLGLLFLHLEVRYGLEPLPANLPQVVRVDLEEGVDGHAVSPAPDQGEGITITAPPVYVERENSIYYRVLIEGERTSELRLAVGDQVVTKELATMRQGVTVSPERRRGLSHWWAIGAESALPGDSPIETISVAHPDSDRRWLGLPIPWWLYWLALATIAAFALRKPMQVEI
jgi:hypothetical protein